MTLVSYRLTREATMPRRRILYRAARTSNNARAASNARRRVRRKAHSRSMGATGKFLRWLGLR
jgi:hypothetical protein